MDIRKRLETDLKEVVSRLRQMAGRRPSKSCWAGRALAFADEVDEIQANERREIGFATRELLVERVNRITAALDRLNDGEYGTCVECSEKIAPLGCARCRKFRPASVARTAWSDAAASSSSSRRGRGRRRRRLDAQTRRGTYRGAGSDPGPLFCRPGSSVG